jgi:TM2 domain-containing membrane protein YozV
MNNTFVLSFGDQVSLLEELYLDDGMMGVILHIIINWTFWKFEASLHIT